MILLRCGIFILFNKIGANKMIAKITAKINTGLDNGSENERFSKNMEVVLSMQK